MNHSITQAPGLQITLTAHAGPEGKWLMVSVKPDEVNRQATAVSSVAVVLDRSGSMQGRKLEAAKQATARLIRSLGPNDRLALVAYDDHVRVLAPVSVPSDALARTVEAVTAGSSTNLYDGWLTGAKLIGAGGRVLLLSDGLANAGRYTEADELARQAGITYEKFRVTTSTIGIGEDYDEALMAGMARRGAGAHYFAHTAESIVEAFSQERFAIGAVALSQVSFRYGGETLQLGHVWQGDVKQMVLAVRDLHGSPATLRYSDPVSGQIITLTLSMPGEFGQSDAVTLEVLFAEASEAELIAGSVQSPEAALAARSQVRRVLLKLLAHPRADCDAAHAVRASLDATMLRLEALEREYDEATASVHRKRSTQASRNYLDRSQAFSSFEEDKQAVLHLSQSVKERSRMPIDVSVNAAMLTKVPIERWRAWQAVPLDGAGDPLVVGTPNPRDGFLAEEIRRYVGVNKVQLVQIPEEKVMQLLA